MVKWLLIIGVLAMFGVTASAAGFRPHRRFSHQQFQEEFPESPFSPKHEESHGLERDHSDEGFRQPQQHPFNALPPMSPMSHRPRDYYPHQESFPPERPKYFAAALKENFHAPPLRLFDEAPVFPKSSVKFESQVPQQHVHDSPFGHFPQHSFPSYPLHPPPQHQPPFPHSGQELSAQERPRIFLPPRKESFHLPPRHIDEAPMFPRGKMSSDPSNQLGEEINQLQEHAHSPSIMEVTNFDHHHESNAPPHPPSSRPWQDSEPASQFHHEKPEIRPIFEEEEQQQSFPSAQDYCQKHNIVYGFHTQGCKPYYFICSPFDSLRVQCPKGMFFDVDANICDYKHLIAACGGKRSPSPSSQKQPPALVEDYCQKNNLIDGRHTQGCKPYYFVCSPVSTTRVRCPKGTFYDDETQLCDYKHLIAACGGKRPPPLSITDSHASEQPPPEFNCTGKTDGFYSAGCTSKYYICMLGSLETHYCPSELVYSESIKMCDYKDNVPECRPQQQQSTAETAKEYCRRNNIIDGYHTQDCKPYYFDCNPVSSMQIWCPKGMFYDVDTNSCDYKHLIAACGGKRPSPSHKLVFDSHALEQPPLEFNCTGKADGLYSAAGCASKYYICMLGSLEIHYCPSELVYSESIEMCDYKDNVPECSEASLSLPSSETTRDYCQRNDFFDGYHVEGCKQYYYDCTFYKRKRVHCYPGLFFNSEIQQCDFKQFVPACGGKRLSKLPSITDSHASEQPSPEFNCTGKADGMHANGCASKYYICMFGTLTTQHCPVGNFFSVSAEMCDYKANVPECGGVRPQPQLPPETAREFCQRNDFFEGYHIEGCKQYYYDCTFYKRHRVHCPAALFFNVEIQQCDYKHLVPACVSEQPAILQKEPSSTNQLPHSQDQTEPSQQPTSTPTNQSTKAEYDCTDKLNGIYVVGCTAKYHICMLGNLKTLTCPPEKFYSPTTEKCDFKEHVPECGGKIREDQNEEESNEESVETEAEAEDEPANACTGLANGIYGRKCNETFVVCVSQKAVNFTCSDGRAFNLKTVKCAPTDEIETCPEFKGKPSQQDADATTSVPEHGSTTLQPHDEEPQWHRTTTPLPSSTESSQEEKSLDNSDEKALAPTRHQKRRKFVAPPQTQFMLDASPPAFGPPPPPRQQLPWQKFKAEIIPDFKTHSTNGEAPVLPRAHHVSPVSYSGFEQPAPPQPQIFAPPGPLHHFPRYNYAPQQPQAYPHQVFPAQRFPFKPHDPSSYEYFPPAPAYLAQPMYQPPHKLYASKQAASAPVLKQRSYRALPLSAYDPTLPQEQHPQHLQQRQQTDVQKASPVVTQARVEQPQVSEPQRYTPPQQLPSREQSASKPQPQKYTPQQSPASQSSKEKSAPKLQPQKYAPPKPPTQQPPQQSYVPQQQSYVRQQPKYVQRTPVAPQPSHGQPAPQPQAYVPPPSAPHYPQQSYAPQLQQASPPAVSKPIYDQQRVPQSQANNPQQSSPSSRHLGVKYSINISLN